MPKYQLDIKKYQHEHKIRSIKREKKAFNYYIRKEKRWLGQILWEESLVQEVIEGQSGVKESMMMRDIWKDTDIEIKFNVSTCYQTFKIIFIFF